jgi:hypothetical protein
VDDEQPANHEDSCYTECALHEASTAVPSRNAAGNKADRSPISAATKPIVEPEYA